MLALGQEVQRRERGDQQNEQPETVNRFFHKYFPMTGVLMTNFVA
jgi:hypothetical protein